MEQNCKPVVVKQNRMQCSIEQHRVKYNRMKQTNKKKREENGKIECNKIEQKATFLMEQNL